jgi:ketosteroid isomerase-like protein
MIKLLVVRVGPLLAPTVRLSPNPANNWQWRPAGGSDVQRRGPTVFKSQEKPVAFDFHDVQITCGQDVAFATAIGKCVNIDPTGKREPS